VRNRKSIAIIDDDAELRLAMESLLRSHGFDAEGFQSAEAFLLSSDLSAYDCLVTDVHMPGMSGLEMIELVRSRGALPIIVISAFEPERTHALALKRGADAYLSKPVVPDDLVDCMHRLLVGRPQPRPLPGPVESPDPDEKGLSSKA